MSEALPTEVLARLDDEQQAKILSTRNTRRGKVDVEVRQVAQLPQLTESDKGWNLRGYATVYDVAYPVAGGPEHGGFIEIIERGATAKSINDGADVRLLVNHEGLALARSASGTMRLISDDMGMMVDADLDPESPYAQSVRSAIARGDVDQMSFAFRVVRQEFSDDFTVRRIKEVQLFDASVVTYPASEATVVQMNSAPVDAEVRDLDPQAEQLEDDIAGQIRELVARLIAGEAAELESGSPAVESLRALVNVLCALDWWEEVDEAEDASGDAEEQAEYAPVEMMSDDMAPMMGRSLSVANAQLALLRCKA
jgi:HK97 family phage prohead protease